MLKKTKKCVSSILCAAFLLTSIAMPAMAKTEGSFTAVTNLDWDGTEVGSFVQNNGTTVYHDEEHGNVRELVSPASGSVSVQQYNATEVKDTVVSLDFYAEQTNGQYCVMVRDGSGNGNASNHSYVLISQYGTVVAATGNIAGLSEADLGKRPNIAYEANAWNTLSIYYSQADDKAYYYLNGTLFNSTDMSDNAKNVGRVIIMANGGTAYEGKKISIDNFRINYVDENSFFAKASYNSGNVSVTLTEPAESADCFDGTVLVNCDTGEEVTCTVAEKTPLKYTVVPSTELSGDTEYVVKLASNIKSVAGTSLAFNNVYFTTTAKCADVIVDDENATGTWVSKNTNYTTNTVENGATKIVNKNSGSTRVADWYVGTTGFATSFSTSHYLDCSVDFKVDTQTYYGQFVFQVDSGYRAIFTIKSDGTVGVHSSYITNSSGAKGYQAYKLNEWNTLRALFDKTDMSITFYVNGVNVYKATGLSGDITKNVTFRLDSETLDTNTSTTMYVDNVYIANTKTKVSKVRVNGAGETFGVRSEGEIPAGTTTADVYFSDAVAAVERENVSLTAKGSETNLVTNVTYDSENNKAVVTFEALEAGNTYNLSVSGITDDYGKAVVVYATEFTTVAKEVPRGVSDLKIVDEEGNEISISDITAGDTVYVNATIADDTPALVILAQFNGDKFTTHHSEDFTVTAQNPLVINVNENSVPLTVTDTTNLTLKAFVWDSIDGLRPLCDAIEY